MVESQDYLNEIEDIKEVTYSTFWQRFFASLIDSLVLTPFVILDTYNTSTWRSYPLFLALFALMLAYKPFLESKYGATVGKMAMKLTIVDTTFQKADLTHILRRNVFEILERLLLGMVAIMAFKGPALEDGGSLKLFGDFQGTEEISFWVSTTSTVIVLVDSFFLLSDSRRRALHDRIGQTFVIQK